jgi:hypothetical protein
MMGEQGGASQEDLFEQAFQDLAMNQLISELPEIAESVASLKILELDPDNNTAVGTFIIMHGDDELHVPVILADNELMPFDTMYAKSIDMMLPLDQHWLAELDRMDVEQMGSAEKPPEGLRTDEDVRNLVVPPTTGRYSYASAKGQLLPAYVKLASNRVKQSFLRTLEAYPRMAKFAFEHYGVEAIREAIQPHASQVKEATTSLSVHFMTMETPVTEIRSVFGDKADTAMRDIALKGYACSDERQDIGELVMTERPLYLQQPDAPGFYRLFKTDGEVCPCMVFPQVLNFDQLGRENRLPSSAPTGRYDSHNEQTRLTVSADGEMCMKSTPFLGELIEASEVPDGLKHYVTTPRAGTPRNGQRGFFYDPDHKNMVALEPIQIENVTVRDGTRTIMGRNYSTGRQICIKQIEGSPISRPKMFSSEQGYHGHVFDAGVPDHFQTAAERKADGENGRHREVVLVPWNYRFVPISGVCRPDRLLSDERAIKALFFDALASSGAPRITMKSAGAGQVYVDGESLSKLAAIQKVATRYHVSVPSAEEAYEMALNRSSVTFYAVNDRIKRAFTHRVKAAQGGGMMAQPSAGAGAQEAPAGGAMDPNVLMQELMQDPELLQAVAADPEGVAAELGMDPGMLMEILSTPELQQMLGGGAGMEPAGPPPPSPVEMAAQEVAQQLMQKNEQIQMQMQQEAQNLETQIQAIQAVMQRANEIAGEQGLEPPAPMEGGAPGEEQPGMPVEEPGMMESAMTFEDPEMFDAAAIASLASNNDYDGTIGAFLPTLRSSLDAIGRLLTEFRMKAAEMKTAVGEETYSDLRDRLESLFQSLGETLVQLGNLNSTAEASPV